MALNAASIDRASAGPVDYRRVLQVGTLAVVVFAIGLLVGSSGFGGFRPATMTGDGYVGDHVVSVLVGGTTYGLRGSVAWRAADGVEHSDGWPDCLTPGQISGLAFAGATVWHGDSGEATILWVDCSGR